MSDLSEKLGIATYRWPSGEVVVRLVGALDAAGADRLIDESTQIDLGPGDRVRLHMQDVTFLDSIGIGSLCYIEAFVHARRRLRDLGTWSTHAHAARERWARPLLQARRRTPPTGR